MPTLHRKTYFQSLKNMLVDNQSSKKGDENGQPLEFKGRQKDNSRRDNREK